MKRASYNHPVEIGLAAFCRGTEYIAELQSMIRFNNLTELDGQYEV